MSVLRIAFWFVDPLIRFRVSEVILEPLASLGRGVRSSFEDVLTRLALVSVDWAGFAGVSSIFTLLCGIFVVGACFAVRSVRLLSARVLCGMLVRTVRRAELGTSRLRRRSLPGMEDSGRGVERRFGWL